MWPELHVVRDNSYIGIIWWKALCARIAFIFRFVYLSHLHRTRQVQGQAPGQTRGPKMIWNSRNMFSFRVNYQYTSECSFWLISVIFGICQMSTIETPSLFRWIHANFSGNLTYLFEFSHDCLDNEHINIVTVDFFGILITTDSVHTGRCQRQFDEKSSNLLSLFWFIFFFLILLEFFIF